MAEGVGVSCVSFRFSNMVAHGPWQKQLVIQQQPLLSLLIFQFELLPLMYKSHWHFQWPCATNSMPNHAKRVRKEASWKVVGNVLHQYWSHSGFFSWEDFFFLLSRVVSYRYNDDLGILVWALPSWDAWGHVKLHGFEWHVKPPTEVHEPNGVARDDIYILDKGAMFFWQTDRG